MKLFFGGISSQTDPASPNTTDEIGVYNGGAAGAILLNRSAFRYDAIQQSTVSISILRTAPIVVSSVIAFCPIV